MIYLDTSALVKLVRREPESDALADWLDDRDLPWVSSVLVDVELPRALLRSEPELIGDVPAVLARVARYDIDAVVRAAAATYPDPDLRSLDAIHLATAKAVFADSLTGFVVYDDRLARVVSDHGLAVAQPGR